MKITRRRVQFKTSKPSRTQQNMKDECDVNSILEKYKKTGIITHVKHTPGQYGDFTRFADFKTNMDTVVTAMEMFQRLPSHVRKHFGNDPANLVDFVMNPKNYDEAVKLGLISKKVDSKSGKNDDQTTKNPDSLNQPSSTLEADKP